MIHVAKLFAVLLFSAHHSLAGVITESPRFDAPIPFPKSSVCSPTTSYGIGDFSKEGYCGVGWGKYGYGSSVGSLAPGEYVVVFLRNNSTGDQIAYHVSAGDFDQGEIKFEAFLSRRDGMQARINGVARDGMTKGESADFFSSAHGQAVMSGVAQGIVTGFQSAEQARANSVGQQREFSVAAGRQVQITLSVQQEVVRQAGNLGQLLQKYLGPQSSGLSGGHLTLDPVLKWNLTKDYLSSVMDGELSDFISLERFLFNSGELSFEQNDIVYRNGILKMAGPTQFVSSSVDGKIALNGVILASWVGRSVANEWFMAQKISYMNGVILEKNGQMPKAREQFQISTELSKITAGIAQPSRLSFDGSGRLTLNDKADLKGLFFDPTIKSKLIESSLGTFKMSNSWHLSKEESEKIAAQREYAAQLQKILPPVAWTFKVLDKLFAFADVELSKGNVQTALLAGDVAFASLDALSNFTYVGAGEAALNLMTGYNIRTGQPLEKSELFFNVLSMVPVRWMMSGKTLGTQGLGYILEHINPKIAGDVIAVAKDVEKLAPYIPDSLARNGDALKKTIRVIQEQTPSGQSWVDTASKVLDSARGLKGFNLENMSEIIENRKLLGTIRDGYASEVKLIQKMVDEGRSSGRALEEIAREAHSMRRAAGEKFKNMTPEALRKDIYGRNLETYGDALGPVFDSKLVELMANDSREVALNKIVQSSMNTNSKLNSFVELLVKELK